MTESTNKVQGKKLFFDTIIYAIGDMGPRLFTFVLIPIYTAYLTTSEYGTYDLVMTALQMVTPIIFMQMPGTIMRYVINVSEETKRTVISTGLYFATGSILFYVVLAWLMCIMFHWNIAFFPVILLTAVTLMYNNMFAQILRGIDRLKLYALMGIMATGLSCLFSILFIVGFKMKYEGIFWASCISNGITAIVMLFAGGIHRFISPKSYSKEMLKDMLRYSIPLIPNAISWWVIAASSRMVISSTLGVSANGIYAVANKLASVIQLCYNVFDKAWMYSAVSMYTSQERSTFYSSVFSRLSKFMFIMVGILILLTKQIMSVWVAPAYFGAWRFNIILVVAIMFYGFSKFNGVGFNCSKKTSIVFYSTATAALLNVVLTVGLIHYWGLYAAAIGTLAAYLLLWLINIHKTKDIFEIKINIGHFAVNFALIILCAANTYLVKGLWAWVGIAILMCTLLFVNRSFFVDALKIFNLRKRRST